MGDTPRDDQPLMTGFRTDATTALAKYPEHLQLIGHIVAEWSNLEFKFVWLASLIIGVEHLVLYSMVYSNESNRARLNCIASALEAFYAFRPKEHPEIAELIEEAQGCLRQRNKYAHALFGTSNNGSLMVLDPREISTLHRTGTLGTSLPLHDLKYQLERITNLSIRIGKKFNDVLASKYGTPPQAPDASGAQPQAETGSTDPQDRPSPQEPPEPSRQ